MKTRIGQFFFKSRSLTPVPFLLILILFAQPTRRSLFLGYLMMALGEWVRIWGVGYAGSVTRTRNVGASSLVTSGPFAFVRNPLYVGNFLLALGVCLAFNALMPWMVLVYTTLFAIQYYFIVALEEATLEEKFGDLYRRYKSSVPRFLPRFTANTVRSDHQFELKKSLNSETRTLMALFLMAFIPFIFKVTGAAPLRWIESLLFD